MKPDELEKIISEALENKQSVSENSDKKILDAIIETIELTDSGNVRVAEKNGASWYGLVFYKKSPRNISLNDAKKIVSKSAKSILPVAVTVNPDEFFIKQLIKIGINNIQLHGNETLEYCLFLKNKFNVKIIKGIGLETEKDIRLAEKYSKKPY